jgi:hypothetical protein
MCVPISKTQRAAPPQQISVMEIKKKCPGEGRSRAASNYFCFTVETCEAYKGKGLNDTVNYYSRMYSLHSEIVVLRT